MSQYLYLMTFSAREETTNWLIFTSTDKNITSEFPWLIGILVIFHQSSKSAVVQVSQMWILSQAV